MAWLAVSGIKKKKKSVMCTQEQEDIVCESANFKKFKGKPSLQVINVRSESLTELTASYKMYWIPHTFAS